MILARAIRGRNVRASFGSTCCITIAADRSRAGDGADGERRNTAVHMVGFAGRQLSRTPARQYSFVIVHVLFLSCQPLLQLSHRVAVFGSGSGTRGTDRQSVDVAGNVVNFRRGQLTCVLATQYSIVFVHGVSFLVVYL